MRKCFRFLVPSALRGSLLEQRLYDLGLFVSIRTWGALTALRLSGRYLNLVAVSLVSNRKIQGSIAARFLHDEWRRIAKFEFLSALLIDSRSNNLHSALPELDFLKALGIQRLLIASNFNPDEDVAAFLVRAKEMGFEFEKASRSPDASVAFDADQLFHESANLIRAGKEFKLESPIEAFGLDPQSPMRLLKGTLIPLKTKARSELAPNAITELAWSIIIPVRNQCEYLPLVLDHLAAQDYPQKSVEILIVDDGSEIPVEKVLIESNHLEAWPFALAVVRIEREFGGTFDDTYRAGIARNAGLAKAKGEKILFLDSDILIGPNLLSELDSALKRHDLVQCPRQMLTSEASARLPTYPSINFTKDTYSQSGYWETFKKTPDWNQLASPWKFVCTYALATKREKLTALGPFRPEFCEYGFEDVELGYRFFRSGASFHLSVGSDVFHLFPKDESHSRHFDSEKRRLALKRSAQLFYRLHMDPSIYIELSTLMK